MEQKSVISEALIEMDDETKKYAREDKYAFQMLIGKYLPERHMFVFEPTKALDLCSGIGRTVGWIRDIRPGVNITCIERNKECIEKLGKLNVSAWQTDVNSDWNLNGDKYDLVTMYGGTNTFINWQNLFENLAAVSNLHIIHFNRNDTLDAIYYYARNLDDHKYSHIAYSRGFIAEMYSTINKFELVEILETEISYIVVGRKIPWGY